MKKMILYIFLALTAFVCCGENNDKDNGPKQSVIFNITTESTLSGENELRYVMAIYDTNGNPQNIFNGINQLEQSSGSFEVQLNANQTYKCAFWADYGITGNGNTYNTSDLKAITGSGKDAFSGSVSTSITKVKYDLILKHAVARIDYIATDHVSANNLKISYSKKYHSLNVLDGSVVTDNITNEQSYTFTGTTGKLASCYMIAPENAETIDIRIEIAGKAKEVKNIPVRSGYKTDIKGEYSNDSSPDVSISDNWNETDPGNDGKETYFPKWAWNVQQNNNYQSSGSQFNIHRMLETPNLVAFWESGFGGDPSKCADTKYRFPLQNLMNESEKIYKFFRDDLKFVEKGNSLTDAYRMVLYFYYSDEGTVYGGSADDKVGVMWITPNRVQHAPYGAIAHEMGHAFQDMVRMDGHWGYSTSPAGANGQTIFEMTSQYMLWQYYPDWIEFENYHLVTFMNNTYKSFLHEDTRYCSPFVLEYWADKHGKDFIAKLWYESERGEDPVTTYKRIIGIDQEKFNNEMLDAYRKFITWDMERIRDVSSPYINQHTTKLNAVDNGWYQIAASNCPQNYGYNGIKLDVPATGTEVIIDFKGIAGATGFRSIHTDKAGWRYGFMASKKNGERVYGTIYSDSEGQAKFTVPENTTHLWFVVTGAPTEHWEHIWDEYADNDEQWPYQIKITGTTIAN